MLVVLGIKMFGVELIGAGGGDDFGEELGEFEAVDVVMGSVDVVSEFVVETTKDKGDGED